MTALYTSWEVAKIKLSHSIKARNLVLGLHGEDTYSITLTISGQTMLCT